MNNKGIIGIIAIAVILIGGLGTYFVLNNGKKNETETIPTNHPTANENDKENETDKKETTPTSNRKTLVVYYSATGSTKKVAEEIAKNLNADLFEIEPVNVYTREDLNYSNPDSRVSKEHEDKSLRDVELKTTKVDNWESYDTVFIGYPIWWGVAAWPVDTFVKENNFDGKKVIPFCTSASSGLGQSKELLEAEANGGNWLEGQRFSSSVSSSSIKTWTDSLK